jgi:hypothetical protein
MRAKSDCSKGATRLDRRTNIVCTLVLITSVSAAKVQIWSAWSSTVFKPSQLSLLPPRSL